MVYVGGSRARIFLVNPKLSILWSRVSNIYYLILLNFKNHLSTNSEYISYWVLTANIYFWPGFILRNWIFSFSSFILLFFSIMWIISFNPYLIKKQRHVRYSFVHIKAKWDIFDLSAKQLAGILIHYLYVSVDLVYIYRKRVESDSPILSSSKRTMYKVVSSSLKQLLL